MAKPDSTSLEHVKQHCERLLRCRHISPSELGTLRIAYFLFCRGNRPSSQQMQIINNISNREGLGEMVLPLSLTTVPLRPKHLREPEPLKLSPTERKTRKEKKAAQARAKDKSKPRPKHPLQHMLGPVELAKKRAIAAREFALAAARRAARMREAEDADNFGRFVAAVSGED